MGGDGFALPHRGRHGMSGDGFLGLRPERGSGEGHSSGRVRREEVASLAGRQGRALVKQKGIEDDGVQCKH